MEKLQITTLAKTGSVWTLKVDVPNRRVTTITAAEGKRPRTVVRDRTVLLTNEAVRRTGARLLRRQVRAGYREAR